MIKVNFRIDEGVGMMKIPPFLLVPFIENAFKHGIDPKKRSIIDIDITAEYNKLLFKVVNEIYRNQQKLNKNEGGIGINNLKKRLEILFPESFILKQYEEHGKYYSSLELKL